MRPPGVSRNECDKSRALILMILLWMFLRMEREIAHLKQRISESEGSVRSLSVSGEEKNNVNQSPVSPIQTLPSVLSVGDERCARHAGQFYSSLVIWPSNDWTVPLMTRFSFRINAYIEEEVQRRLQKLNLLNRENNNTLSLSSDSLQVLV